MAGARRRLCRDTRPFVRLSCVSLIIRLGKIAAAAGGSVVLEQIGHGAPASRRLGLFFAESSLVWELGWWYALLYFWTDGIDMS